jgi:hypothetical protein
VHIDSSSWFGVRPFTNEQHCSMFNVLGNRRNTAPGMVEGLIAGGESDRILPLQIKTIDLKRKLTPPLHSLLPRLGGVLE